jgi:hypothetical protein
MYAGTGEARRQETGNVTKDRTSDRNGNQRKTLSSWILVMVLYNLSLLATLSGRAEATPGDGAANKLEYSKVPENERHGVGLLLVTLGAKWMAELSDGLGSDERMNKSRYSKPAAV